MFGEWGLENHAPMVSNSKASAIFLTFWGSVGLFGYYIYSLDHASNRYTVSTAGIRRGGATWCDCKTLI